MNANIPDMTGASQVQGPSHTVDPAIFDGANMIGIDFLSDAVKPLGIDDKSRRP